MIKGNACDDNKHSKFAIDQENVQIRSGQRVQKRVNITKKGYSLVARIYMRFGLLAVSLWWLWLINAIQILLSPSFHTAMTISAVFVAVWNKHEAQLPFKLSTFYANAHKNSTFYLLGSLSCNSSVFICLVGSLSPSILIFIGIVVAFILSRVAHTGKKTVLLRMCIE